MEKVIKVLFVCHGNICRSPMAQCIFQDLVEKEGLADQFVIDSAATSTEEIGNSIYPPARRTLQAHGVSIVRHAAVQLRKADDGRFDYLIGMEQVNIRNILRIVGKDPKGKVCRLLDFTDRPADIDDPWYTGDFETTYQEILTGCTALLTYLMQE